MLADWICISEESSRGALIQYGGQIGRLRFIRQDLLIAHSKFPPSHHRFAERGEVALTNRFFQDTPLLLGGIRSGFGSKLARFRFRGKWRLRHEGEAAHESAGFQP